MKRDVKPEDYDCLINHKSSVEYKVVREEAIKAEDQYENICEFLQEAPQTWCKIEEEFYEQIKLQKRDLPIFFTAVALQVLRIILINYLTQIEKAGKGNKKEDKLHLIEKKIMGRFQGKEDDDQRSYYASLFQITHERGVPYDATAFLDDKYKIFKGANHRFSTLGHDPVLGLLFGTMNIMTNTITCIEKPIISTYHVKYENYKNPKIASRASTVIMIDEARKRIAEEQEAAYTALIRQIIHIGTDLYTPCGIALPGVEIILPKKKVEMLTKCISTGDVLKMGGSSAFQGMIDWIISSFHSLTYDEMIDGDFELFLDRTRKILLYSNVIAESSNLLNVAIRTWGGQKGAIKRIDWGGIANLCNQIVREIRLRHELESEFVTGRFIDKVRVL